VLAPQLSAIFPDTIAAGRRTTVVVLGLGTAFDGTSVFSAGANVTVHSTTALSPTALKVDVTADVAATLGARNITVTAGGTLTLFNGLTIAPAARGTVTAGTLAQGGAVTVRIEVSNGKTFTPSVSGTAIVPLNTTVAGTGFTVVQTRWVTSTIIDTTALISPLANTMTPPSLTVTFDDATTAAVPLSTAIAATTPVTLPTASTPGNLSTLRGAVYSVAVTTAPLRLTVTTTTTGTPTWTARSRVWDAAGNLLGDGAGSVSGVANTNGTYFVSINDSLGGGANATFTLLSATTALAANAVCSAGTALVAGTAVTGELISTGGTAPTACLATATGPSRYYTVTVPAGEGVTVRVTPTVAFDANLRVIDGCAATTCAISADNSTFSTTTSEVVTLRNTDLAAPHTYTVVVGSSSTTTTGTYTLLATRQAYLVTTVPTACEDMTAATPVLAGAGTTPLVTDDAVTAAAAMPIAFNFFGVAQTFYTVTNNGFVQLGAATFTGSSTFSNATLPGTATPNNIVAPFWDDFNITPVVAPATTTSTRISVLTIGAAPPRTFVVQWFDVTGRAQNERVTMQAKFFEGTNVIEFHYCSLVANAGSASWMTGDSATIGLDNATGSDTGLQWSFNTPTSISTANALQFTPAP
jgi:hypothetical protein